jgi:hypothetical protein
MILINPPMLPPPADLLEQAIKTNDLEPLAHWFIRQPSPGYSFQTIVDFVAERRSTLKPKAKRAPSAKKPARKATTTTQKAMEIPQL